MASWRYGVMALWRYGVMASSCQDGSDKKWIDALKQVPFIGGDSIQPSMSRTTAR
jgi:hypothetical protein